MSNLLDKASILLTPTAYNDGSMLSIKPELAQNLYIGTRWTFTNEILQLILIGVKEWLDFGGGKQMETSSTADLYK